MSLNRRQLFTGALAGSAALATNLTPASAYVPAANTALGKAYARLGGKAVLGELSSQPSYTPYNAQFYYAGSHFMFAMGPDGQAGYMDTRGGIYNGWWKSPGRPKTVNDQTPTHWGIPLDKPVWVSGYPMQFQRFYKPGTRTRMMAFGNATTGRKPSLLKLSGGAVVEGGAIHNYLQANRKRLGFPTSTERAVDGGGAIVDISRFVDSGKDNFAVEDASSPITRLSWHPNHGVIEIPATFAQSIFVPEGYATRPSWTVPSGRYAGVQTLHLKVAGGAHRYYTSATNTEIRSWIVVGGAIYNTLINHFGGVAACGGIYAGESEKPYRAANSNFTGQLVIMENGLAFYWDMYTGKTTVRRAGRVIGVY